MARVLSIPQCQCWLYSMQSIIFFGEIAFSPTHSTSSSFHLNNFWYPSIVQLCFSDTKMIRHQFCFMLWESCFQSLQSPFCHHPFNPLTSPLFLTRLKMLFRSKTAICIFHKTTLIQYTSVAFNAKIQENSTWSIVKFQQNRVWACLSLPRQTFSACSAYSVMQSILSNSATLRRYNEWE